MNSEEKRLHAAAQTWAQRLFSTSVITQEKFREIERLLPPLDGKTCLDIGGDTGVISYRLRQMGGTWHSADLVPAAVDSIRRIVGTNVHHLDSETMPFADGQFDLVAVIDYLEHLPDDRRFVRELRRVLKPGGMLILKVPHAKPGALLRPVRNALGLTDDKHGHVRPGYRIGQLMRLLADDFTVLEWRTYSRFFTRALETLLSFLYACLQPLAHSGSRKGVLVRADDFLGGSTSFRLFSAAYPFFRLVALLDHLLFFTEGYALILGARKR